MIIQYAQVVEDPLECGLCGSQFAYRRKLQLHLLQNHEGTEEASEVASANRNSAPPQVGQPIVINREEGSSTEVGLLKFFLGNLEL